MRRMPACRPQAAIRRVRSFHRREPWSCPLDGEFATAPFLHVAGGLGVRVVARLKANLPGLFTAAQRRFVGQPPTLTFAERGERIALWDADDFDP
jgi:hypothetical protein